MQKVKQKHENLNIVIFARPFSKKLIPQHNKKQKTKSKMGKPQKQNLKQISFARCV